MRRMITLLAVLALFPAVVVGMGPPPAAASGHTHTPGVVDTATGLWHVWDPLRGEVAFYYGDPGDVPFVGDWDCDGEETPGLFRQSDAFVYLRNSNTQGVADIRFFFGNPDDVPLAGDFNGDGCDTVSVYRPSESRVFVINELGADEGGLGAADFDYVFGDPGDTPFVGDFDGDDIDTIGLHRVSTGRVYFRNSHSQGNADADFIYGDPDDVIMAGDWNGDGADSVGIYRSGSAELHLRYANSPGIADELILMDLDVPAGLPVAGAVGRSGMVSFADYGCGSMAEYTVSSLEALPPSPAPTIPSDAEAVLGMSFTHSPGCDRAVISLKDEPGFSATTPAVSVPEGVVVSVDGNDVKVALAGIEWGAATNEFLADPYAFIVVEWALDNDDLYAAVIYPEYRLIRAQFLSDPARIVVDSVPSAILPGADPGPVLGDRLHLRDPLDRGVGTATPIEVVGYARPFEGDDLATLTDLATGGPASASFWGCDAASASPGGCVYRASAQGPEWGEFRFSIGDLAPGTYRLDVFETSPLETDPGGVVSDTFTISGPGTCNVADMLPVVETTLGATPGAITLDPSECVLPYARVFAVPSAPNLESEQVFLKEIAAATWEVLAFGTGIDCRNDTDFIPPELETACEVLGLR